MAVQMSRQDVLAPRRVSGPLVFHEVWENNFEMQFEALLHAVTAAGGCDAIVAMDMEFPGFPCNDPQFSPPAVHHQALRCNVDQLWPIQVGVAVMGADGMQHGVWTFNLRFDPAVDTHTEESLTFLCRAGLDIPRHRTEGISALELGCKLAHSSLIGPHGLAPCWLTFSGSYDWAYLLKLVTLGKPLPSVASSYEKALAVHCPKRHELRDFLPEAKGSLEALGRMHGVKRSGKAHTAGSDALLTAELFLIFGAGALPLLHGAHNKLENAQHQQGQWSDTSSELSWQNEEGWFSDSGDEWYAGVSQTPPAHWDHTAGWAHWSHADMSWYPPAVNQSSDSLWYNSQVQHWLMSR